jgi:glycosyltransferase involved in cell wall biosynthesis
MRILFCNYEYPPLGGGGGVFNKQIAEELAKRHTIDVLTSQGMNLPKFSVENGVNIYRVPVYFRKMQAAANLPSMLAYLPSGYRTGKKLLKEHDYDVVNTHFAIPSGPLGKWLAKKAGVPNVLTVQGGDLYDPSKFMSPHRHYILRSIVKNVIAKSDAVVAASNNSISNVHEFYDANQECKYIPLGIERPPQDMRKTKKDFGLDESDIALVTVGRLVARKGLDRLLKVVARINNPRVHLFVVGSGPQLEPLLAQAQELGITDQIHLLGQVDDVEKQEVLKMSDIYVSTSQHEGFGIVYLEAMTADLPVICYDYGGQTDFLSSDETGYVVKLNDEAAFLDACTTLIEQPDLRHQMAKHNLEVVESFYIENCAGEYEALFKKVIADYKS